MKWVKHQLTKAQADALHDIAERDNWSPAQIVRFQLFQNIFFVSPFYYVECLQKVIGYGSFNDIWDKQERARMIKLYLEKHSPPMCEEMKQLLGDRAYLVGL